VHAPKFRPALTRRHFAGAALAALAARPAWALSFPAASRINCKVFRGATEIGTADYVFTPSGDRLAVAVDVDIRVRVGFITLFSYRHHNLEHWVGDRLLEFTAHTLRNGAQGYAYARWNGTGLAVTGSQTAPYVAPPNAIGTSYWNFRTVSDPLIDTQNGRLLKVAVTEQGPGAALQADGTSVPATEYTVNGEIRLNLWYTSANDLAGLQYYAHDGSILSYERS
jgi:hypothetical protein